MVNFTINKKQYQFPSTWGDITIKEAVGLHQLCKSIPTKLKEKYDLILASKDHDQAEEEVKAWIDSCIADDTVKDFPEFYGKVILSLSDVPQELIDYTTIESRLHIYTHYLEKFVLGAMYNGVGYDNVGISSFDFKGFEYFLPSDKRINDLIIPMDSISTVQFCEASDLMAMISKQKEGFKYSAYIIAILCLTKGEVYNEEKIIERSKEFEDLPMDIVWEVFFCLVNSLHTSRRDSQDYFHQKALSKVRYQTDSPITGKGLSLTSILSQTIPYHWN